jgi:hypothetical protein
VYETILCPEQKISTRYKSTKKLHFHGQNAPFESARGTGEGGRNRDIAAAGRVWQQQGEHGLVAHVPRYRMVRFDGYPRQVEGAGRDTVKNL